MEYKYISMGRNSLENFKSYLENIEYPKSKTSWGISGNIKGHNAFYKFDISPICKFKKGIGKLLSPTSKADKIVFENDKNWLILDIEEIRNYCGKKNVVSIDDLISKLDWNIILPK